MIKFKNWLLNEKRINNQRIKQDSNTIRLDKSERAIHFPTKHFVKLK